MLIGLAGDVALSSPFIEVMKTLGDMRNLGNIETAAIVSRGGLLLKAIPEDTDNTLAAMTAIMLGAAEAALSEVGKAMPDRIIVETGECRIVVMGAGQEMLLTAIIDKEVNTGLALLVMERAAEKIRSLSCECE